MDNRPEPPNSLFAIVLVWIAASIVSGGWLFGQMAKTKPALTAILMPIYLVTWILLTYAGIHAIVWIYVFVTDAIQKIFGRDARRIEQ